MSDNFASGSGRRCSPCIKQHGRIDRDTPIFHGHVISKGAPATFRCSMCGRKAYWNTGDRVPSISRWLTRKIRQLYTDNSRGGKNHD